MDYIVYIVNRFNMSETDILMTLFVAVLSLILFAAWIIDCVIKWRRMSAEDRALEREFAFKLLLLPILSILLISKGIRGVERRKRIKDFLYA